MSTADEYINLLPSELGATTYVEIIIISRTRGTTNVRTSPACGRVCGTFNGYQYTRDLYEPSDTTVQALLNGKGYKEANYTPYYRNYNTNTLTAASYGDALQSRKSIVYVDNTMSAAQLQFTLNHITSHREILPSRMVR